jgi:hypothetical protein
MRIKSATLLVIFLASLIPFSAARAETGLKRDLDDAVSFLYVSEAILLDEDIPEEVFRNPGLLSQVYDDPVPLSEDAVLAGMLNAAKNMRNDLNANCRLLTNILRQLGKDCEVDKVQSYRSDHETRINSLIGSLHDKRGDKRKGPTKIWHFLKRSGRGLWNRIGKVGRTFLRRLGPEVLHMVVTGGFGGGAIRKLIKLTAKSIGRERIREVVFKGVQRLLQGQVNILQAAGVNICSDEEESSTTENNNESSNCSDNTWVDEFWNGAVLPNLEEENKLCQTKAASRYYSCLQEQAFAGFCPEDAVELCHSYYEAIPPNDSGGSVTLSPTILHGAAESVSTSLTYSSGGGAVAGQFFFTIYDSVSVCTVTVSSTVVGSYDQSACSMSGTAQLEAIYDGYACPSVCGPSTGACPKTFQSEVPWNATLKDGELFGGVGGEIYVEGSFGFRAGP